MGSIVENFKARSMPNFRVIDLFALRCLSAMVGTLLLLGRKKVFGRNREVLAQYWRYIVSLASLQAGAPAGRQSKISSAKGG